MTPRKAAAVFTVCLSALGAAAFPALRWAGNHAMTEESASHIVLVPLVTVALVFQRRQEIFRTTVASYPVGVPTLVAGLALSLSGRVFASSLSLEAAVVTSMAGVVVGVLGSFLLAFGVPAFRAALFPLLFLVAAVPIPGPLLNGTIQLLKAGSAEAVAALFWLTSTPFHREGFLFSLPNLTIEIADECSGIRSSIALTLTSLLGGYTLLHGGWARVALLGAVLPITIVKNAIRIVALSLATIHVDPTFITGRLHHDGGVVFFGMALVLMLPWLIFLRRLESRRRASTPGEVPIL